MSGYEVAPFETEHLGPVERVLRSLWGEDRDANLAYFRWKYEQNPYSERPLGVVATRAGDVVGFRGYFATRWHVPGSKDGVTLLTAGDTCVHPEHRRSGLSVAMGQLAREEFAAVSPLLLNLSSTPSSLPGYLRLGFAPVAAKARWVRFDPLAALRSALGRRPHTGSAEHPADDSGVMTVTDRPRPAEMAELAAEDRPPEAKLALLQDERFFEWRYRNPRSRYRFWYLDGDSQRAYLVVRSTHGGRQGFLVDHAGTADGAIEALVRRVVRCRHFALLSAHGLVSGTPFTTLLSSLGFSQKSLVLKLAGRSREELPMLVRPLNDGDDDARWRVGGLDVRRPGSWEIKGICYDSA